ncbi:MAG: RNA pseudouridine synthase [Saprospiraceae bacterium]
MNHLLKDLKVIYEDNHIIAVNKPNGVLVQGDKTGDDILPDLVKEYIKLRYKKPGDVFLGVIHRLDRPVSGVVVFARTSKALTRLNEMMRLREIQKTYFAMVWPRPEELEGKLVHYLTKDPEKNIVRVSINKKPDSKEAILHYRVHAELDGKVLLKVNPLTGRPHQIRAQLSRLGCPIIGDLKYGATYPLPENTIALHSYEMKFIHPVKKEWVTIQGTPPKSFPWNTFERSTYISEQAEI